MDCCTLATTALEVSRILEKKLPAAPLMEAPLELTPPPPTGVAGLGSVFEAGSLIGVEGLGSATGRGRSIGPRVW